MLRKLFVDNLQAVIPQGATNHSPRMFSTHRPGFHIKPLSLDELEQFIKLCKQTYYDAYSGRLKDTLVPTVLNDHYLEIVLPQELASKEYAYNVARLHSKQIGYAKTQYVADGRVLLEKLYLLREHQKQGFGKQLLLESCRQALMRGCNSMHLNVWEMNHGAIAFYESLGFRRDGKVESDYGSSRIYTYQMVADDIENIVKASRVPARRGV